MKKIIVAMVIVAVLAAVIALVPSKQANTEFLRIHIRADSNESADQNVKYEVKSAVVDYLTPFVAQANSKQEAMNLVRSHLQDIKRVCDGVLAANGFDYKSNAKLCAEQFPDRTYDGVTLEKGVYDALIIELGSGSGNNWWCVVYPPLCFVGGESNGTNQICYKSKILEIIRRWQQSHNG